MLVQQIVFYLNDNMRRKISSLDEISSDYAKQYIRSMREKGRLTPEEKENMLHWLSIYQMSNSISQINKEVQGMKPLVMGGYPKFLYDAVTPYYQVISYVFIFVGILLILISSLGFFIPNLSAMVSYLIPSTLSLIFGIIILMFLRTLDVKK